MKPISRSGLGYLMSAPLLLWLLLTIAVPLVFQIWISLTSARTIGGIPKFIALTNYSKILSNPAFLPAFGRSLIWAFGGAVLQIIPAALIAAILNMKFRWQQLARTWIMISWVVPTIVVVFVWRLILNVDHGVADYILLHSRIISKPADFLGSPNLALLTTMLINAWRWFPFLTIIIIAGLRRIPEDCYDAAKVDGATAWKRLTAITLPLLQPVFYVSGLMGTLWSINVFDIIWLSTRGGPLAKTETLPVLIYERAFEGFNMGQASAIAVVLAIFLGLFSAMYILFVPAGDAEQEVF